MVFKDGNYICPTCGRQIYIQWNPLSIKVIIPGDETCIHIGGDIAIEAKFDNSNPFEEWIETANVDQKLDGGNFGN